jgi:hypothetical protein
MLGILHASVDAAGQDIPVGIIDFYGLHGVPAGSARAALTFREGDTLSFAGDERPAALAASEARLAALPGVESARFELVCCDSGRMIVFVGITERGQAPIEYRSAPVGEERLPADVVATGEEFTRALELAVQRGDAAEDRSQGHALNRDSSMRACQDRFLVYAKRDLPALRQVLRNSSNPRERALSAQVLGYAPDKAAVVDDLVYAMSDPDPMVRNNATRALMVMAEMKPGDGRVMPQIPAAPFITLLNSPVWSDRNKAAGALEVLTGHPVPGLLDTLRRSATGPLVEMARWKSQGHAQAAYMILARIGGYADDVAYDLLRRGERETVIRRIEMEN